MTLQYFFDFSGPGFGVNVSDPDALGAVVNQNTPVLAPCTSRLRDENLVLNSLAKEK